MKKIAFIGQPEYFSFVYEGGIDGFETKEFPFNFDMSEDDLTDLVNYQAEYNFFFRGEYIPDTLLEKLSGKKIALSSEPFPRLIDNKYEFTKDSIKRFLEFRKRIRDKKFDYVFHYDKASLEIFKKDGLCISGEFIFPVSRKVFKPLRLKKDKDFFFLGRSTSHREAYFGHLKHYYNFLHIAHGVYNSKEFNRLANESKINLNIHAENEISWEPRMQILLASGAFVISEKITPNEYLEPGKDYIEVRGPSEIFEKAKYFLENPNEMEAIVASAGKKIEKYFDSDMVFDEFIKRLEGGQFQEFKSEKTGSFFLNILERILL